MIKDTELRKGNYVRIRDYILCVKSISETLFLGNNPQSDFVHDSFKYEDVEPISLTPEILGKCGFTTADEDGVQTFTLQLSNKNIAPYSGNEYKLFGIKARGTNSIQIDYTVNRYWAAKSIHYLHELQNLYLWITGEELEIKLEKNKNR